MLSPNLIPLPAVKFKLPPTVAVELTSSVLVCVNPDTVTLLKVPPVLTKVALLITTPLMLPPVILAVFCVTAILAAIQLDTTTLALAILLCKSAGVIAPSTSLAVSTTLPTRPATVSTGCTGVPDVVNVATLPILALPSVLTVSVTSLTLLIPPSALPSMVTVFPTAYPEP